MNRIDALAVAVAIIVVAQAWSWLDDDGVLLPETPEAGARQWISEQPSQPDGNVLPLPRVPPLPQAGPNSGNGTRDPFRLVKKSSV